MDYSPLLISLKVSLLATALTFVLGLLAARFVVRLRRFQSLMDGIFTLPMILPPTVVGFFLLLIFGKNGVVGRLLAMVNVTVIFTWIAAVIASAVVSFPLMYRTVRGALEELDSDMVSAARTLGLSECAIFFRIIIPNIVPSIIAGTVLAFARALGEFGATIMLAGNIPGRTQTMSIAIYEAVYAGDDALANTLVLIASGVCIALLVAASYAVRRGRSRIVPL